jgi:hypothetical protein
MLSRLEQDIQAYTEKVQDGPIPCQIDTCPHCRQSPPCFHLHDVRPRRFLVVVERLVRTVLSLLVRWKCPLCSKTFTAYPSFALPYKRYVRPVIMEASQRYLDDDRLTYRQGVCQHDATDSRGSPPPGAALPIFREGSGEAIDERALAASTLHRWITTLGHFPQTLHAALRLLAGRDASLHRQVDPIPAAKYRSEARRVLLQDCLRLLRVQKPYRCLFGVSIFPRLATTHGWT